MVFLSKFKRVENGKGLRTCINIIQSIKYIKKNYRRASFFISNHPYLFTTDIFFAQFMQKI